MIILRPPIYNEISNSVKFYNQQEILIKSEPNLRTWDNLMIRNSYFLNIQHKKSKTFICTKDTGISPVLAMTSILQIFWEPLNKKKCSRLNCKDMESRLLIKLILFKFRFKMPTELLWYSTCAYSPFTSCSLS